LVLAGLAALSVPGNTRVFVVRPDSAGSGIPGVAGFQPAPGETAVYVLRDGDTPIMPPQVVLDQTKQAVIAQGRLPTHTREQDVYVMAPTLVLANFNFASITPDTSTVGAAIEAQLAAQFSDSVDFEESVGESAYLSALYATRDLTTRQLLADFTPVGLPSVRFHQGQDPCRSTRRWRTYRSGRIEQGGVLDAGNLAAGWSTSTRILLPIAVPTASYSTFLTAETNDPFGNAEAFALGKHDQKSVNSFTIGIRNATSLAYDIKINWTATYGCPVSSRATTMPSGNGRQNQ
jgi:hypothetical protein